jgi:hypothetical protein
MDNSPLSGQIISTGPIDCACVIHGNAYSWSYVERLYNMLNRHISVGVRFHVYTEADRTVPAPWIKHALTDWKISGPKKAWWYKMQLFDPAHHSGPLLYFDLDVVIVNNIDWIWKLPLNYFWTIRDFKYLWRPTHYGINSSVMWWHTQHHQQVWQAFSAQRLDSIMRKNRGDQDYLTQAINKNQRNFFDFDRVASWRWQALDGGYNFGQRMYNRPGAGTVIDNRTSVLIFHGDPKPDQVADLTILQHWQ